MSTKPYEKQSANYVPLTPVSFLNRAAIVFADEVAVIYGERSYTYREFHKRSTSLATGLKSIGINSGDTVAVMLPNIPEMLEAHFGVPMAGAVLCSINTRLDSNAIQFILNHSEASVLIVDREFAETVNRVLPTLPRQLKVIVVDDPACPFETDTDAVSYEDFLQKGSSPFGCAYLCDEWDSIALNYTSGTTGNPKGVLLHHRGAYLNACANALTFGLSSETVYLWTLPMFHCNGWTYTWAVAIQGGTNVCLRNVAPKAIYAAISREQVTHMCAAPIILNQLSAEADTAERLERTIHVATGGAPPPSSMLEKMESIGFSITHLYGMTESYGPSVVCVFPKAMKNAPSEEKARFMIRQGVAHCLVEAADVVDTDSNAFVPADGHTLGELVIRSNTVMKGYYKNEPATSEALADGWLHTGDIAVKHPDYYIEIKDRLKDIIISGGENISSVEIEEILYMHPAVSEVAVVAQLDEKWGETPHAFVSLKETAELSDPNDLIAWCRARMAHFKCPRHITLCELPKTGTGKVQKHLLRERLQLHDKA